MVGLDGVEGHIERERERDDGKYASFSCSELGKFYWVVIIMPFFFVDRFATNVRCQLQASCFFAKFVCDDLLVSCLLALFPFLNIKNQVHFVFIVLIMGGFTH
jgi:hypothetical protein